MARKPRIHFDGAVYHVWARGVDKRSVFSDDIDCSRFVDRLNRLASVCGVRILAYCLMGNHFHLAVKVGRVRLSTFMQRLQTSYCVYFNRRHDRSGHLFQARYDAVVCLDDRYLANVIPYIHMNPVSAGLVAHPKDWKWSSYREGDSFLVDPAFDPWPTAVSEVTLLRKEDEKSVGLDVLGRESAAELGIDISVMRTACRLDAVVAARILFVQKAIANAYPLSDAAKWLNTTRSSVSRYAARGGYATTGGLTPA